MTEELPAESFDDPDFNPSEPIEKEKRGTLMRELESWECVIDGLKMASDGCRHIARRYNPDRWNRFAMWLDAVRKAMIRDGGYDQASSRNDSVEQFGGEGIPLIEAQSRVRNGLKKAASGCDQIAHCQRLDFRWLRYAQQLRAFDDNVRRAAMKDSQLATEHGWRNNKTGLLVPARLH